MYGTRNTCTFYITNLIYCVNLLIRPPHDITWAKGERVTMLTWTLDQKIFQYQKNLYIIYTIILFPEKYWLKYWLFHYKSIFPQSSLFFIYTVIFPHFTNPMHTLLIFSHEIFRVPVCFLSVWARHGMLCFAYIRNHLGRLNICFMLNYQCKYTLIC